ncbi:hypothetical protein ACXR0O_25440 [Verrucomicrobiota bacterium sgz303538]
MSGRVTLAAANHLLSAASAPASSVAKLRALTSSNGHWDSLVMTAWLPPNLEFTEIAVLSILLEQPGEPFSTVRQQLALASAADRELTGAGFYRHFTVPSDASVRRDLQDCEIDGVIADHPELESGAGFILFIRDGTVSFLEGFTYGVTDWPTDEDSFTFFDL